jgi:hypothetical protein
MTEQEIADKLGVDQSTVTIKKNGGWQNMKKYKEEIRMLREELGLDQIEFEFDDFCACKSVSHDKHLEIDLEFDDEAIDQ